MRLVCCALPCWPDSNETMPNIARYLVACWLSGLRPHCNLGRGWDLFLEMEFFCKTIFVVDNFFLWCVLEFNFPLKKKRIGSSEHAGSKHVEHNNFLTRQTKNIWSRRKKVGSKDGSWQIFFVWLRIKILWKMLYFKFIISYGEPHRNTKMHQLSESKTKSFHTHVMRCAHFPRGEKNRFVVTFLWHITTVGLLFMTGTLSYCDRTTDDLQVPLHNILCFDDRAKVKQEQKSRLLKDKKNYKTYNKKK